MTSTACMLRCLCLVVIAAACCLSPHAIAQPATVFGGELYVSKTTTVRQLSATTAIEEGHLAWISVGFPFGQIPSDIAFTLRGPGVTLELVKLSEYSFEYRRPFNDRETMDRAIPDGQYTVATSRGTLSFTVSSDPAVTAARITNYDTLQRWNGRDSLAVTLAPTPNGAAQSANFSVTGGSIRFLGGNATLTSPSTTIRADILDNRFPTTPGQVLDGEAQLTIRYESGAGTTARAISARNLVIKIPVARAHLPPQIIDQPAGQTLNAGTTLKLAVNATGGGLGYVWQKDSRPIAGATDAALTIAAAQPADSGVYTVLITNTGGAVLSNPARVTVNPVTLAPAIATAPAGVSLAAGSAHTFTVSASGTPPFAYQWLRDGVAITGATTNTLTIPAVRPADAGSYTVVITNASGAITSAPAVLSVTPINRISNLSIRTRVGGTTGALTVGITVGGGAAGSTKPLLLRAVGPTLGAFGVDAALADPQLALLAGEAVIAQNDDWGGSAAISSAASGLGAFALVSDASKDAALLPAPAAGSYTLRVSGVGAASGIALAEVYDGTPGGEFVAATPRLINVSALTQVGTGGEILIAGFSIAGSSPKSVLVRGIGPTLAAFGLEGALADPRLDVFAAGSGTPMETNDNWAAATNAAEVARVSAGVGAFALVADAKDAALLLTLPPGSYTAQVSGVANSTGTALVEVYEVP